MASLEQCMERYQMPKELGFSHAKPEPWFRVSRNAAKGNHGRRSPRRFSTFRPIFSTMVNRRHLNHRRERAAPEFVQVASVS